MSGEPWSDEEAAAMFGALGMNADGTYPARLREAWEKAVDRCPLDWFGPRVEPRWPNRWRAWYEHNQTRETMDGWGATEAEALVALADIL